METKYKVIDELANLAVQIEHIQPQLRGDLDNIIAGFALGIDAVLEEGHSLTDCELWSWQYEVGEQMLQRARKANGLSLCLS